MVIISWWEFFALVGTAAITIFVIYLIQRKRK